MSKERELPARYMGYGLLNDDVYRQLVKETKELLAQPEPEPVAWMYDWNIMQEEEYGETEYDALTRVDSITKSRAITNVRPLYTVSPQKWEPLIDKRRQEIINRAMVQVLLEDEWISRLDKGIEIALGIGGE
jgi:hypothetical protein